MMTPQLDFPSLSNDAWAATAPMAFAPESAVPAEVPECPWGYEMMSTPATVTQSDGKRLGGRMVQWDPAGNRCLFLAEPDFRELTLPLSRLREVTLDEVMAPGAALGGMGWAPPETPGLLAYSFRLEGDEVFSGTALRHVERPEGHYLNIRVTEAGAFVRSFVGARFILGAEVAPMPTGIAGASPLPVGSMQGAQPSAGVALVEPVRTAAALRAAVKAQVNQPVRKLGDMLVSLQLLSVEQLARVLAGGMGNGALPLGERLVRMGLVSPEGLQRALHLKMGYPLVDLQRFEFDQALLKRLPRDRASAFGVLPLAFADDGRLIAAVDDPGNSSGLQALRFVYGVQVAIALPSSGSVRSQLHRAYRVDEINGLGLDWGR
jgi:hypothetical protein